MDDSFCLFVILASMVTVAMPAVAQTTFAVFAAALALASRIGQADRGERSESGQHRGVVG